MPYVMKSGQGTSIFQALSLHILRNDSRIMKLLAYDAEPKHHFIVDVMIMSCPVYSTVGTTPQRGSAGL
jgi:hypothetical protein